MAITTASISDLREITGAGLIDCKKALQETEGDVQKAVELLRQKGIASASKKAGKIAAEGSVKAKVSNNGAKGVLVEVNCQTDFVAKNEKFQQLLDEIIDLALNTEIDDITKLKEQKISSGETIQDLIAIRTSEIGEKIDLRRVKLIKAAEGEFISEYTHPVGSKISVLVKIKGENEQVAKDIAMHVAATIPAPEYLDRNEIPEEVIENERRIELGKEDLANKPKEIAEKIVNGRVEKALMEKVLTEQSYIKNPSQKIKEYTKTENIEIIEFCRFNLGEGIEKKEENFAEEVAAAQGKK
ncbi:MAG: translation elongation factor Ts [Candidatus Caenarcaniphilales bacterium]|nr:translation elongation factor Ts [Candidatus Caenarcaniphilales bacterium]